MRTFGYCRVSGTGQNERRQLDAMAAWNIPRAHIFTDKQSGKDFHRPAYRRLIREVERGDLLCLSSLDRLGRDYAEVQEQWRILTKEKGVDIKVLDMPLLDTRQHKDLIGTFISDLVLQVLSFVGQSELEQIRRWQAEGIAAARAQGVHLGRPAKAAPEHFREIVAQWARKEITLEQALLQCDMARSTFYRKARDHWE